MLETLKNIFRSYIGTVGIYKFIVVIFFGAFCAFLTVLEPVIFTKIISYIEEYYKTGFFDTQGTGESIVFWVIFSIFTIICLYINRYFLIYKNNMSNYVDLCKDFNKKIVHMEYSEYLGKKQGSLYKIYDRGTLGQEQFLYFFFGDVLRIFSSLIVIFIILLFVDIRMTFLVFSMVPVMLLLGFFFITRLSKQQRDLNDRWDKMYGVVGNILSSFMLTKVLTLEGRFIQKMSGGLDEVLTAQHRLSLGWSIVNIYTGAMVVFARILVLGFGVYYVINDSLSFSALFLVFSYVGWIYFPIGFLIDKFNNTVKDVTSTEKMYKEFGRIEPEDIHLGKTLKSTSGNIEFKNVSFGYSEDKKILQNIDLKIKKGQQIALVGNTGAGKSTLVNLLLRFWDVDSGEILLDGNNVNDLKKSSLRSHIGVVSQDNSLFNLSIEENLKFADPKATKKQIEDALKNAEAQFVFDLKDGIKTVIGERGLKLSGGEKQRISIARLFLKNPEILVLDEATSALDNTTEKKIEKALKKLMKGKTSIIIAHRLSTIQHADKICVLEHGKIVETGNYDELMKQKGKFYSLANPDKLILG